MRQNLEALRLDFRRLKMSDKEKIKLYVLDYHRLNRFHNNSPEIDYLAKKLMEVYDAEKGDIGNDRLFSVGREMSSIFKETEIFELLEANMLMKLQKRYRQKMSGRGKKTFFSGKAESLMAGFGPETSAKLKDMINSSR